MAGARRNARQWSRGWAGSGPKLSRQVHPGHFSVQIDDRLEA